MKIQTSHLSSSGSAARLAIVHDGAMALSRSPVVSHRRATPEVVSCARIPLTIVANGFSLRGILSVEAERMSEAIDSDVQLSDRTGRPGAGSPRWSRLRAGPIHIQQRPQRPR
jgi:hypothetical protein